MYGFFGGDEGDRTPYLLHAMQALSQVSYTPKCSPNLSAIFAIISARFPKVNPFFKKSEPFFADGIAWTDGGDADEEKGPHTGKASPLPLEDHSGGGAWYLPCGMVCR